MPCVPACYGLPGLAIVFSYYGIFMWLPSLIYQQGFTIIKSFEYLLIMTIAQFPGYISAAYLVDKIGRRYTLSLYLYVAASAAISLVMPPRKPCY